MRRKEKLPELLSPAGDFECLVAAVRGGADAVYVGGKLYSARAYAKNFDIDELRRAVAYCHLHGVRLYVTLNTLLYDRELRGAVEFARELYKIGVDALIIADVGLISVLRECLPELELHASTQMSVHNSSGADVAYSLGCTRVVLAREVSGADMARITRDCKPQTEVFLHGALCVCHSGQCLFSSMVGGRSGNRGECAQPCRLPYNGGKYPLSLSDLSLAGHIPELIAAGVASLKIEGRMKSPDYVYTVTSIYRTLLDEGRAATRGEIARLEQAFSRGGFTDGYFRARHNAERMTGTRSREDKAATREMESGDYSPDRISVRAEVRIVEGEPAKMAIFAKKGLQISPISVLGAVPEPARSVSLSDENVRARLSKMGNTFLSLLPEDIDLELGCGINLSPAALNALRRAAAEAFEVRERELIVRDIPEPPPADTADVPPRTAVFYKPQEYDKLGECRDFFDASFVPLWKYGECDISPDGVALPPVIMESELAKVEKMLADAKEGGARYALVGNIGHIELARSRGFELIPDFRLNQYNSYARAAYAALGLSVPMLSPELNEREAGEVGGREIVYGRIPLMITERCFMREWVGCDRCGRLPLADRLGIEFPVMREWEHRNLIFNSAVTYVADKPGVLSRFDYQHYIFSTESADTIRNIVRAYQKNLSFPLDAKMRRIGKRDVKSK